MLSQSAAPTADLVAGEAPRFTRISPKLLATLSHEQWLFGLVTREVGHLANLQPNPISETASSELGLILTRGGGSATRNAVGASA